jgi:apolipoprotein N-acyltransferase
MKSLSKNKILATVAFGVILLLFNVISFAIPFTHNAGFWSSYVFSTLAIVLTAAMSFYALGRADLRSRFYGLPILYIVWIYLGIQLVAGFIFASLPTPLWLNILLSVVLLGVCFVGLIAVEISVTEIERIGRRVREKVFRIKSLQDEVDSMRGKTADAVLKKALQKLSDAIRYSDPVSSPQLAEMESNIEHNAAMLDQELEAGNTLAVQNICDRMMQLLAERNRKCRLLK